MSLAQVRRQQQLDELCAASARALSGVADLHYRGRRLHRGRRVLPLYAPHLHPAPGSADLGVFRGAADAHAVRLTGSDAAVHAQLGPADPVERVVFELLEQFRAEALVPDHLPGVRHNLRHCFAHWSSAFQLSGLADTASGILLFTVAQVCRARVTGDPMAEDTEDLLEATRAGIGSLIGAALAGLRRDRADQRAYAVHALHIAATVGELLRAAGKDAGQSDPGGDSDADAAFALVMDVPGEPTERFASAPSGRSRVLEAAQGRYRVFTTAYDRECTAASLVRPEQRLEYRAQLDRQIELAAANIPRLARELRHRLAVPAPVGWEGGQEEGLIDGRRLSQLVAAPRERRLFQTVPHQPVVDCVVSFLIDCSGSMRAHAAAIAMLLDLFARALELAGGAVEILGFTTGAWSGGRAHRDWLRAGRPAQPGRLNEVCHMVFKDADTPWRRARPDIAALLRADLFREGVDGEAVAWAARRLEARDASRKQLIVVSDGSPMDSATQLANDAHYLDHHLADTVQAIERGGRIGIAGLGVGLDLSPYYRRSHVLDLGEDSTDHLLREIAQLLPPRP